MASDDMDTPQPVSLQPSPASPSLTSGLAEALANLPSSAVRIYAISKISPLFATTSSCADDRWKWGLAACVAVALPTIARYVLQAVRNATNKPR